MAQFDRKQRDVDHRKVVERELLVASANAPPLLQPADNTLDDVALTVGPRRKACAARMLTCTFREIRSNVSLARASTNRAEAVALVSCQLHGTSSRSPAPLRDTYGIEDGLNPVEIRGLSGRQGDAENVSV